jgi:hypothetical protein
LVKDNVYLFTVTFWNSGELSIEPEDVRIPVTLTISPCKKILDYQIIEAAHPNIADFSLREVENSYTNSKSIVINWNHLDPNFGVKIQVIYAGTENPSISFDGMIVGVGDFTNGRALGKRNFGIGLIAFLVPLGFIFFLVNKLEDRMDSIINLSSKKSYKILITLTILIFFLFALFLLEWWVYLLFFKDSPSPF